LSSNKLLAIMSEKIIPAWSSRLSTLIWLRHYYSLELDAVEYRCGILAPELFCKKFQ
jgi:hypothetical protein